MSTITFTKVLRDCPYNDKQRHTRRPRFIYDHRVMIDGEWRATFCRMNYTIGFDLYDPDGHHLPEPDGVKLRYHGGSRFYIGLFMPVIKERLDAGLIPTLAQLAANRAAAAKAAAKRARADREDSIRQRKMRAGVELYDALKEAVPLLPLGPVHSEAMAAINLADNGNERSN